MTDIPSPAPEPTKPALPVVPHRVAPDPAATRRHNPATALTLLALALLALGGCWLWLEQQRMDAQMARFDSDVARLDGRPAPDFGPMTVRLAALERRLVALEQRSAAPGADIGPLDTRLTALEQRPAQAAPTANLTPLEARLAALEARPSGGEAGPRLAALERAQAASARLSATEAALRLEFRPLAARAIAASKPALDDLPMLDRVWLQLRSQVTVSERDKVLMGSPAAVVLGDAQEKLDAGDLAGAVAALGKLDPGAAAVMADWRARAAALLDARAAVAAGR